MASTTEEDRQTRIRDRFNEQGYESVALIPLKTDREIIGLLQLNDKRKGMFTLNMIEFFEDIAASIGIAFERKKAEQALKEAHENLEQWIEERTSELEKTKERFRLAAKSSSDLIYEWDVKTGQVAWFGDVDKALGYELGQFSRTIEGWLENIHPNIFFRQLADG